MRQAYLFPSRPILVTTSRILISVIAAARFAEPQINPANKPTLAFQPTASVVVPVSEEAAKAAAPENVKATTARNQSAQMPRRLWNRRRPIHPP